MKAQSSESVFPAAELPLPAIRAAGCVFTSAAVFPIIFIRADGVAPIALMRADGVPL
jgi:hypothetical protein